MKKKTNQWSKAITEKCHVEPSGSTSPQPDTASAATPEQDTQSPLSIYYTPEEQITYGWGNTDENIAGFLNSLKDNFEERLNAVTQWIDDILLALYQQDEAFRNALSQTFDQPVPREALQLKNIPQKLADLYYERLTAFQQAAGEATQAPPMEYIRLMVEAQNEDAESDPMERSLSGDKALKRIETFGIYNDYADLLAGFMRQCYAEGKLYVTASEGHPSPLSPATFIGWGGPECIGQSFSLFPETFSKGYAVIRCSNWNSEDYCTPEIIGEWSSGIKVVAEEDYAFLLTLDEALVKDHLIVNGRTIPTSLYGPYVVSIRECGEFRVDISYRPLIYTGPEDDILLFSYDFICK